MDQERERDEFRRMEVDVTNPEIAWMDAEHARLQAQARWMKKGLIDAATENLERATSPFSGRSTSGSWRRRARCGRSWTWRDIPSPARPVAH